MSDNEIRSSEEGSGPNSFIQMETEMSVDDPPFDVSESEVANSQRTSDTDDEFIIPRKRMKICDSVEQVMQKSENAVSGDPDISIDSSSDASTQTSTVEKSINDPYGESIVLGKYTGNEKNPIPFYVSFTSDDRVNLEIYPRFHESSFGITPDVSTDPLLALYADLKTESMQVHGLFSNYKATRVSKNEDKAADENSTAQNRTDRSAIGNKDDSTIKNTLNELPDSIETNDEMFKPVIVNVAYEKLSSREKNNAPLEQKATTSQDISVDVKVGISAEKKPSDKITDQDISPQSKDELTSVSSQMVVMKPPNLFHKVDKSAFVGEKEQSSKVKAGEVESVLFQELLWHRSEVSPSTESEGQSDSFSEMNDDSSTQSSSESDDKNTIKKANFTSKSGDCHRTKGRNFAVDRLKQKKSMKFEVYSNKFSNLLQFTATKSNRLLNFAVLITHDLSEICLYLRSSEFSLYEIPKHIYAGLLKSEMFFDIKYTGSFDFSSTSDTSDSSDFDERSMSIASSDSNRLEVKTSFDSIFDKNQCQIPIVAGDHELDQLQADGERVIVDQNSVTFGLRSSRVSEHIESNPTEPEKQLKDIDKSINIDTEHIVGTANVGPSNDLSSKDCEHDFNTCGLEEIHTSSHTDIAKKSTSVPSKDIHSLGESERIDLNTFEPKKPSEDMLKSSDMGHDESTISKPSTDHIPDDSEHNDSNTPLPEKSPKDSPKPKDIEHTNSGQSDFTSFIQSDKGATDKAFVTDMKRTKQLRNLAEVMECSNSRHNLKVSRSEETYSCHLTGWSHESKKDTIEEILAAATDGGDSQEAMSFRMPAIKSKNSTEYWSRKGSPSISFSFLSFGHYEIVLKELREDMTIASLITQTE